MPVTPSRSGLLPEMSLKLNMCSEIGPLPLQSPRRSPLPALLGFCIYSGPTFCSFQKLLCIYVLGNGQAGLLVLSISNMMQRGSTFPMNSVSLG